MKKEILLGMVSLVGAISSMEAGAQVTICSGASTNNTAVTINGVTTAAFVLVTFTPKCSNNIVLMGSDNTTFYTVGASSLKGLSAFRGSSAGGGVIPDHLCTGTPPACTTSDVTTAIQNAPSS